MKKILLAILVLATQLTTIAMAEEFKIGVVLPLSGPLAEYGVAEKNGILMAKSDHPEIFEKIELLFEDSQYDPKMALSAFNKLKNQDKANLIYDWGAATGAAISPVAESLKFPLLSMSIDPTPAIGKNFVIRFGNYAGQYISKIVPYLRSQGIKKIGIVNVELAYTNSMLAELRRQMNQPGEEVSLIASVNPGESDFRAIVNKLKQQHFDAIGIYLMSGQISEFYQLLKLQHNSTVTFGTDFFESSQEISQAHGAMEGAVYPHNPVPQEFKARYVKTYGNDSQLAYAVNGYDFAMLVGNSFGGSTPLPHSTDEIISRLTEQSIRHGIVGEYTLRNEPAGGRFYDFPIVLKRIQDGRVVEF